LAAGLFIPNEHRSQEREQYVGAHGSHLSHRLFLIVSSLVTGTAEPCQPRIELGLVNGFHDPCLLGANDTVQQQGGLERRNASESRNARPVCCNGLLYGASIIW
jgi:hypothetical protein